MPLEACMIIMDNSEYMRNGDYPPTRYQAQKDAVSVLFNAKTGSNPESSAGVMSMAGDSPQVLATLTQDFGKILSSLSKSHISGSSDLLTALSVAQLALKHRENKNQRQRIVVFCGSPVLDLAAGSSKGKGKVSEEEMVKLGKKMKKNNVAVDVVLFGEEGLACEEVLSKFVEAVNAENSHLVTIPAGPHLLSDLLVSSPILAGEGGAGGGGGGNGMAVDEEGFPIDIPGGGGEGGGGGGGDDFGGIDPNMDPEMAMAIRMSIQEEEERQRRLTAAANPSATEQPGATASASTHPAATAPGMDDVAMEDIGQQVVPAPTANTGKDVGAPEIGIGGESEEINVGGAHVPQPTPFAAPGGEPTGMAVDQDEPEAGGEGEEDEDEEEAMLRAIAMSMEDQGGAGNGAPEEKKD